MNDYERTQSTGIVFGDWKLIPNDGTNWELAHRHVAERGKNKGKVQWHRLGRYYQYNTVANALEYAADCEAKAGCADAERDIREALAEYRGIVAEMERSLRDALCG